MPERDFDTVVIGAGIGGLLCANILASQGQKVCVAERHLLPGGYCSSFTRNGYTFDSVVESIGGFDPHGVVGAMFRHLGLTDDLALIRLDPIRINVFGTRSIPIPSNPEAYAEQLAIHFPNQEASLRSFLGLLLGLFRELRSLTMRELWDTPISPELAACRDRTWTQFAQAFVSPEIADLLAERSCFLGLPPSRVSALAMVAMMMNYFDGGAYRIRGGYQKLADLLVKNLIRHGSTVLLGQGIRRIRLHGGAAVGAELDSGETLSATDVVSNIDARRTLFELMGPEQLSHQLPELLEPLRPSPSFVVIHFAISEKAVEQLRASNIGYYPGGSVERSYRDEILPSEGNDFFIGLSIPTLDDRSLAPPNRHILTLHFPVPHRPSTDWKTHRDRIRTFLLKRLEEVLPGLSSTIEFSSIADPETFERYTANSAGSAYGWAHTQERPRLVARLLEAYPDHLFQVGHWGEYGGGTVGAMVSGQDVARKILRGCTHPSQTVQHVG